VLSAAVILVAGRRPEYSHLRQTISELGTAGQASAAWMNWAGIIPAGVLVVLAARALSAAFGQSRLATSAATILALGGGSFVVAGLYPWVGRPGDLLSSSSRVHLAAAVFGFFCFRAGASALRPAGGACRRRAVGGSLHCGVLRRVRDLWSASSHSPVLLQRAALTVFYTGSLRRRCGNSADPPVGSSAISFVRLDDGAAASGRNRPAVGGPVLAFLRPRRLGCAAPRRLPHSSLWFSRRAQGRGGRYGDRSRASLQGSCRRRARVASGMRRPPPGQQPAPTDCRDAERVASRDRSARVIYGDRTIQQNPNPNPNPYPGSYPYPGSRPRSSSSPNGRYAYGGVSFDNGYTDGYDKGREDVGDNRSYDPVRHRRYRSADHGYDQRLARERKNVNIAGFQAGATPAIGARAFTMIRRQRGAQALSGRVPRRCFPRSVGRDPRWPR
jgi:hypothetical protein